MSAKEDDSKKEKALARRGGKFEQAAEPQDEPRFPDDELTFDDLLRAQEKVHYAILPMSEDIDATRAVIEANKGTPVDSLACWINSNGRQLIVGFPVSVEARAAESLTPIEILGLGLDRVADYATLREKMKLTDGMQVMLVQLDPALHRLVAFEAEGAPPRVVFTNTNFVPRVH